MNISLIGEANDYVGKGINGGSITIVPEIINDTSNTQVILGNTCLYGATGGKLFALGIAGERFGVRNSGAHAVIEGAGDHCCEYMTGGVVVVLGKTGRNIGAGMTGGIAFILDEKNNLDLKKKVTLNLEGNLLFFEDVKNKKKISLPLDKNINLKSCLIKDELINIDFTSKVRFET